MRPLNRRSSATMRRASMGSSFRGRPGWRQQPHPAADPAHGEREAQSHHRAHAVRSVLHPTMILAGRSRAQRSARPCDASSRAVRSPAGGQRLCCSGANSTLECCCCRWQTPQHPHQRRHERESRVKRIAQRLRQQHGHPGVVHQGREADHRDDAHADRQRRAPGRAGRLLPVPRPAQPDPAVRGIAQQRDQQNRRAGMHQRPKDLPRPRAGQESVAVATAGNDIFHHRRKYFSKPEQRDASAAGPATRS
jgi:hypothetical protein